MWVPSRPEAQDVVHGHAKPTVPGEPGGHVVQCAEGGLRGGPVPVPWVCGEAPPEELSSAGHGGKDVPVLTKRFKNSSGGCKQDASGPYTKFAAGNSVGPVRAGVPRSGCQGACSRNGSPAGACGAELQLRSLLLCTEQSGPEALGQPEAVRV